MTEVGVYQSPSMPDPIDNEAATTGTGGGSGLDQSMSIPISS